jgi:hypothetical protein
MAAVQKKAGAKKAKSLTFTVDCAKPVRTRCRSSATARRHARPLMPRRPRHARLLAPRHRPGHARARQAWCSNVCHATARVWP